MSQSKPSSAPTPAPVIPLRDLVGVFVADTEAAQQALASKHPRGPVTGLKRLDETLGTYLVPGLHTLQGAPGCGKTALALQIASDCRYPALYVSAEMPLLELFRRLIARQTQTFLGKLKTGELGVKEAQRLALAAIERLGHLVMMDGTRAPADVNAILAAAESVCEAQGSKQILIVIDSLTVWARSVANGNVELSSANEYELINAGVAGCVQIAGELTSPVLALSHRNRAGQDKGGLHAAKGSGAIEYESETVLDLVPSEKEQQPDANSEIKVKLIACKNRNGIPNIPIPLRFCGRLQSFKEDER